MVTSNFGVRRLDLNGVWYTLENTPKHLFGQSEARISKLVTLKLRENFKKYARSVFYFQLFFRKNDSSVAWFFPRPPALASFVDFFDSFDISARSKWVSNTRKAYSLYSARAFLAKLRI